MTYKTKEEAIESIAEHHRGVMLGHFFSESLLGLLWDEALVFASSQEKEKEQAGDDSVNPETNFTVSRETIERLADKDGRDASKEVVWRVSVVDDVGMAHDFTTKQRFAKDVAGMDGWIGWERYEGGYVQFDLKGIKSIHSMPIGKDGD